MRWLWATLAVLIAAVAGTGGWIYLGSERALHHHYALPPAPVLPRPGPEAAVRGAHLAAIYGCTDCHGDDLRGRDFPHPDPFHRVTSANLTLKARAYSDADLARVVRQGLRPDGVSVEFMPSDAFVRMSDADLVDIVAYTRALPAGGADIPEWDVGWKGRWELVRGRFPPGVNFVRDAAAKPPLDLGPQYAAGRAIASVACVECHGSELKGGKGPPPDLRIAGAYDAEDFRRLMKTGIAAGGRQLPMMSPVARKRFSHFTDAEVEALRQYLVARANAPA